MDTELQLTNLTENSWYYNTILPNDICISVNEYMQLWSMKPNFKNKIKLFGKTCTIPREQMVYGIYDYSYSGTTFPTQDIPPILQKYLDWANQFEKKHNIDNNHSYNMILVNWYENGHDYIGAHRDDEKQIIPNTNVYTFSFGTVRNFKIHYHPKFKKNINENYTHIKEIIPLTHNSIFIMGGHFQNEFKHQLPKCIKISNTRISITLRKFK